MSYTIYETVWGKVEKVIECPADMLDIQFDPSTHAAIEGSYADDRFYIDAGVPVEVPERPSAHHIFNFTTKEWEDPRTEQDLWNTADSAARSKRAQLLKESDWTQLPDIPVSTSSLWVDYRQALRDITDQSGYPFEITWPTIPQ